MSLKFDSIYVDDKLSSFRSIVELPITYYRENNRRPLPLMMQDMNGSYVMEVGIYDGNDLRKAPQFMDALEYRDVRFSLTFIREFEYRIHWDKMSDKQEISINFIREMLLRYTSAQDWIWNWMAKYMPLTEELMEEFSDMLDWYHLSSYQKMSEQFIEKHLEKISWVKISEYQKLSEDFIRKYKNLVFWRSIVINQKLSENFLEEIYKEKFIDDEWWKEISVYQELSMEFMKKHNIEPSFKNYFRHIQNNSNYGDGYYYTSPYSNDPYLVE